MFNENDTMCLKFWANSASWRCAQVVDMLPKHKVYQFPKIYIATHKEASTTYGVQHANICQ